jgi:hypothetical protein
MRLYIDRVQGTGMHYVADAADNDRVLREGTFGECYRYCLAQDVEDFGIPQEDFDALRTAQG